MIMFIFGLVVLVVNDFVDFNFMSSNYLKKEGLARSEGVLARSVFPILLFYKKDLGRR